MPRIRLDELEKIVKDELALHEAPKGQPAAHAARAAVSGAASDLLGAIDDFLESATPAGVNAVTPHIEQLRKVLEHMNDSPGAYIMQEPRQAQRVSLKAVKSEGRLNESHAMDCPACGARVKAKGDSDDGFGHEYLCDACDHGWET